MNLEARTSGAPPPSGTATPEPAGETGPDVGSAGAPGATPPTTDRGAAFAAGPPKMPRRVIYAAVAVILVVGLGASLVERVARPSSSSASAGTGAPTAPSTPVPPQNAVQLHAPLPAFLGLSSLHNHQAPAISLTDAATGSTVTLADLRGHVVVLTFANAECDDICPVLASELTQADALLGTTAVPVTFVTVNSDPLAVKPTSTAPIVARTQLGGLANWRFLTGTVHRLNPIWKHYDVAISANRSTGTVSHNNVLYFIAPDGTMAWRAMPFANESANGAFSLSSAEIARFAQGVAHYADQLAGSS